jgi:hypothetical protein
MTVHPNDECVSDALPDSSGLAEESRACAVVDVSGQHSLSLLRASVESAISSRVREKLETDLFSWLDTSVLPTRTEASRALILNTLERLLYEQRHTAIFCLGLVPFSSSRTAVAISADPCVADVSELSDVVSKMVQRYAAAAEKPFEELARAHPPGASPNMTTSRLTRTLEQIGDPDQRFGVLLSAYCIAMWLVSGFNPVVMDLFDWYGESRPRSIPSQLAIDMSEELTPKIVLHRVSAAVAENRADGRRTRNLSVPRGSRAAVFRSRPPEYAARVGKALITIENLTRLADWQTRLSVTEGSSGFDITVEWEKLDRGTLDDLLAHVSHCILDHPEIPLLDIPLAS